MIINVHCYLNDVIRLNLITNILKGYLNKDFIASRNEFYMASHWSFFYNPKYTFKKIER